MIKKIVTLVILPVTFIWAAEEEDRPPRYNTRAVSAAQAQPQTVSDESLEALKQRLERKEIEHQIRKLEVEARKDALDLTKMEEDISYTGQKNKLELAQMELDAKLNQEFMERERLTKLRAQQVETMGSFQERHVKIVGMELDNLSKGMDVQVKARKAGRHIMGAMKDGLFGMTLQGADAHSLRASLDATYVRERDVVNGKFEAIAVRPLPALTGHLPNPEDDENEEEEDGDN